jgi:hypothetical protein
MRADRAGEPTKSENITVTWRRSARSSGDTLGVADTVATSAEGALPPASLRRAAIASRSLLSVGVGMTPTQRGNPIIGSLNFTADNALKVGAAWKSLLTANKARLISTRHRSGPHPHLRPPRARTSQTCGDPWRLPCSPAPRELLPPSSA